jgi:hypothetical protein
VHACPRLALAAVAAALQIAQRQPASALVAQGQTVPAVYAEPGLAEAAAWARAGLRALFCLPELGAGMEVVAGTFQRASQTMGECESRLQMRRCQFGQHSS